MGRKDTRLCCCSLFDGGVRGADCFLFLFLEVRGSGKFSLSEELESLFRLGLYSVRCKMAVREDCSSH